ncbi:outer membrane protein [Methylobacterium aerolatum]|uniref:Outer membrane immunogenic protein n=1 Tax=Methylobacterium aerolatum TaxID=418708 RepID=A0ABU0HZB5_9HYPH|nr:porin family protein [Methylobacterium aerolatum]MDQ0446819.1 outer membrane immunogenic protein [Methylobacterium aerolatum]GJD33785.1 hypothetical protein FMGBMHLM_0678 [Methylobacterium aerolatum]
MKSLATSLAMFTALTAVASAADLPRRAAPPPVFTPVPVFTWTGAYFGVNAGYAWSDNQNIRSFEINNSGAGLVINQLGAASVRSKQDGFTGGGQIGYNYQFTPGSGIVVGIEADAAYTDLDRRRTRVVDAGIGVPGVTLINTSRQSLDFLGTVRGRIGYAFDRFMIYGTGGFAYGNVRYQTATSINAPAFGINNVVFAAGRSDSMETGYAYGGGIEYALPTDNFLNFFRSSAVTLKVEYLHYDLGRRNVLVADVPSNPPTFNSISRFKTEGNIVRGGINYKVNWF